MIHPDCQKNIMDLGDSQSVKRGFLDLMNAMSEDAEIKKVPNATIVINFYDEETDFNPGDWAAELHLVIRKVSNDSNSNEAVECEANEEGSEGRILQDECRSDQINQNVVAEG